MKRPILITGVAGFIGSYVALKFLEKGEEVIGIDNINDYYDGNLKKFRLKNIQNKSFAYGSKFSFSKFDLEDKNKVKTIFAKYKPKYVINMAAQAGVRNSINNPHAFIQSNLVGFTVLLEESKNYGVEHFIFASSSSVYGGNKNLPFSEKDNTNHPVSLYAATKRSNELIAHSYSHIYKIPVTGLRFFTVYGPMGRPDMAPMIFANAILKKEPIKLFNKGNMKRDFTFIEDVANSIFLTSYKKATSIDNFDYHNPTPETSSAPFRIFNVGNGSSIELLRFVELLEDALGVNAIMEFDRMQKGDVVQTYADNKLLNEWINYTPSTTLNEGIKKFADWFKSYYKF